MRGAGKASFYLSYPKNSIGSAMGPAGGVHDAPPDPLVVWEGRLPHIPLGAFGATRTERRLQRLFYILKQIPLF